MPCRCLRTKKMYTHGFDAVKLAAADSSTAVYWCIETQTTVGPDDDHVGPERCNEARRCFESDLSDE